MEQKATQTFVRRFFASRMFLIILFLCAVLVALNFARAYYQDIQIRDEIKSLEKEVDSLQQRRLESIDILKYVTSDAFVEEKARTELNLRKPGERVAIIETEQISKAVLEVDHAGGDRMFGNPIKWWYYFIYHSLNK